MLPLARVPGVTPRPLIAALAIALAAIASGCATFTDSNNVARVGDETLSNDELREFHDRDRDVRTDVENPSTAPWCLQKQRKRGNHVFTHALWCRSRGTIGRGETKTEHEKLSTVKLLQWAKQVAKA